MVRILDEKETKQANVCTICGIDCPTEYTPKNTDWEEENEHETYTTQTECPKCKNILTEFDVEMIVSRTGCYGPFGFNDAENEIIMAVYKCPVCGHVISDDEEEAKAFVSQNC